MKKLFIVALLATTALLTAPTAKAQVVPIPHNEISASYGVPGLHAISTMLNHWPHLVFNIMNELDPSFNTDITITGRKGGSINLGYSYQLNKTVGLGITGGYLLGNLEVKATDDTGQMNFAEVDHFFTIMSTGKFMWFRKPVFGMYSRVGLGVVIFSGELMEKQMPSRTFVLPTGQLSAVGMEVGKGFCGFLELGAGCEGIVQAGIRARF